MKGIDGEVGAVEQLVLGAERDAAQKQALEQLAIDKAARVCLGDRLMGGQALTEPVAEKAAQVEAQRRHPQQLTHRPDPLQRARQHQLHQHDRVDRGAAKRVRVVRPRRLTHEAPVDDRVDQPIQVVIRNKLIKTGDLDLPRRLLTPRRPQRHPRTPSAQRNHSTRA